MTGAKVNWTPKRKGDLYCSTACGSGCTYAEYEKAKASAASLAAQCGPGWKPKVGENMGWYYRATKGCATVSRASEVGKGGGYICYFNATKQFIGTGKTPKHAIADALLLAKAWIVSVGQAITEVQP